MEENKSSPQLPDAGKRRPLPDISFTDGPPCLAARFSEGGFGENQRRMGFAALARYLHQKFDDWENHFGDYNVAELTQGKPLRWIEMEATRARERRALQQYPCNSAALAPVCDRRTCMSRPFGVSSHYDAFGISTQFTDIKRCELPNGAVYYSMRLAGEEFTVTIAQFSDRKLFNRILLAKLGRCLVHCTPQQWSRIVDDLASRAENVVEPTTTYPDAQLWKEVTQHIGSLSRVDTLERLARDGGRYESNEEIWFLSRPLLSALAERGVAFSSDRHIYNLLRAYGGRSRGKNFSWGYRNLWSIAASSCPDWRNSIRPTKPKKKRS